MCNRLSEMISEMMEEALAASYVEMEAAERLAAAGCDDSVVAAHLEMATIASMRFEALRGLSIESQLEAVRACH